jgi:hypothetical protein
MDADTKRQFKELRPVVFALATPPAKEQWPSHSCNHEGG